MKISRPMPKLEEFVRPFLFFPVQKRSLHLFSSSSTNALQLPGHMYVGKEKKTIVRVKNAQKMMSAEEKKRQRRNILRRSIFPAKNGGRKAKES